MNSEESCRWCREGFGNEDRPPIEMKFPDGRVVFVHEECAASYLMALKGAST